MYMVFLPLAEVGTRCIRVVPINLDCASNIQAVTCSTLNNQIFKSVYIKIGLGQCYILICVHRKRLKCNSIFKAAASIT
jgi:hypothetical protein